MKDCIRGPEWMYVRIEADIDGSEEGLCERVCPTNQHKNKITQKCEHKCYEGHFDEEGYCV